MYVLDVFVMSFAKDDYFVNNIRLQELKL